MLGVKIFRQIDSFKPMEDLLKFSHFLELGQDTRKLILDMVRSMHSLLPSNPVLTSKESGINYTVLMDQASEILELVREKQEIFDGIFNPDELEKYIMAASGFGEIGDQIEKLLNAVREYQILANYLTYSLAITIKDHLEMIHPEECKALNDKLAGIYRPVPPAFTKIKTNLKVV
jgi:hypothetical protein